MVTTSDIMHGKNFTALSRNIKAVLGLGMYYFSFLPLFVSHFFSSFLLYYARLRKQQQQQQEDEATDLSDKGDTRSRSESNSTPHDSYGILITIIIT